jgi:D-sedoheptulose 7-phosphate isomerase
MGRDAGVESLYPFLYAGDADLDSVLAQVRRSTVEKAAEIVALRRLVVERDLPRLVDCARAMARSFTDGGRLFAFGNGGSSTDAQAVAATFLHPGPGGRPLPALSLTDDVAVVTALANDVGFDVVFARQLAAFAKPGDIAVGLSTSGNSDNLIRAFEEASRRGLLTVGLAGYQGGKMAETDTIDHLFVVPSASVHRIQEAQTTTYHVLWELTQAALAADGS